MRIRKEKTEDEIENEKRENQIIKPKVLNDLSIIIQGKIFGTSEDPYEKQLTLQCIHSIRNLMPKAEIIVSTWEGEDVSDLPFDKVIFNKDPGAIAYTDLYPTLLNNNNRQITSTINGLRAAKHTYAIKMRGDCKFIDTDFTNYLREFPRGTQYAYFKKRIIIPTKYSRNPRRIAQLIHPSDIFQMGLREDLLSLWNIQLQPEPETTRAFPMEHKIFNNSLTGGYHRMKFGAEQYIWHSFCKKNGLDIELDHYSHLPVSKIVASDMSIINNFVIEDAALLGVVLPKKMLYHFDRDLYTYKEWEDLSERYARGVSKPYKWALISQVYYSNISRIVWRAQHRLFKFGVSDFVKVFNSYVRKPRTPFTSNTIRNTIQQSDLTV
jgi:hypothetical protein